MTVSPIPPGFHTVTPCLVVEGASRLIDFLKTAFGAEVTEQYAGEGGKVMHAEVRIGDSMVMLGEASPQHPATPSHICLFVADTMQR